MPDWPKLWIAALACIGSKSKRDASLAYSDKLRRDERPRRIHASKDRARVFWVIQPRLVDLVGAGLFVRCSVRHDGIDRNCLLHSVRHGAFYRHCILAAAGPPVRP